MTYRNVDDNLAARPVPPRRVPRPPVGNLHRAPRVMATAARAQFLRSRLPIRAVDIEILPDNGVMRLIVTLRRPRPRGSSHGNVNETGVPKAFLF